MGLLVILVKKGGKKKDNKTLGFWKKGTSVKQGDKKSLPERHPETEVFLETFRAVPSLP